MTKQERFDRLLLWAMFMPFCTLSGQLFLYEVTGIYSGVGRNNVVHAIVMAVSAIVMLVSAFIWIKTYRSLSISVALYAFVFLVFAIQYFLYPENRDYLLGYVFKVFLWEIPTFINSILVKDEISEVEVMKKASLIIVAFGLFHAFFDIFGGFYKGYSMSFGYEMLLPACFFTYYYFEFKSRACLILTIVIASTILVLGSRGSLITFCFYFVSMLVVSNKSRSWKIWVVFLMILAVVFSNQILGYVNSLLNLVGIESRTLGMLASGTVISNDSGRGDIQKITLDLIRRNWFFGAGMGSDMKAIGAYPHNLVLEVVLHFGIPIGGLLLIGLAAISVVGYVKAKNKKLYLLYFTIAIIPLVVSGTYLASPELSLFLGYAVRTILKERRRAAMSYSNGSSANLLAN